MFDCFDAANVAAFSDTGVPGACQGPPFRLGLQFTPATPYERRVIRTVYMQELLKAGISTVTGVMLPSYAHTDETLQRTLLAVGEALSLIAHHRKRGSLERALEIPLL